MAGNSSGTSFRSLADQVRAWPEPRLAQLLRLRPDLATPAPQDSGQLAARAATRASVLRALDRLTLAELCLLHALVLGGQTPRSEVRGLLDADPDWVGRATARLEDLALVWESATGLRPLTVVAELLGRAPEHGPGPVDVPPALATTTHAPDLATRAAAGAAFDAVRRVELLLDSWGSVPPPVLRAGGLGVRDLRAAAALLHVDERAAAFVVELASSAGLLAVGAPGDLTESWLPTDAYDAWCRRPAAERWTELVRAWLASPRTSGDVGARDASGKPLNALAPGLVDPHHVDTRALALSQVAALPPGEGLATGTGVPSLVARVRWLRPRRPASQGPLVAWAIEEAALLGVTGLGGLTPSSRLLLDGDAAGAAKEIEPLLPAPLDHILVQGDLTAIAPGPLESHLASKLHQVADVESRGGATVYRFTAPSVRRALDAGWSAQEIHDFLDGISRTPVPQPLSYLVDDTARTFGTLRVGYAEAFLRTDDEAALETLLRDKRAASLGLRKLASTVVVSTTPIDILLPRLRDLGLAPVVEAEDGTVRVARPDVHRARTPKSRPTGREAARESAQLASAVAAIRAGDRAAAARPAAAVTGSTPAEALAALRIAIEEGASVWIGYVDNHGTTTERIVDPKRVEGGQLTAYDHRSEDVRGFAVHRITAVRAVDASTGRPASPAP
jgi:hypothetical protein